MANRTGNEDITTPARGMDMGNAAGGWSADGNHHNGSGANRTDPANDHARGERAPAMTSTSPSYQTGKGMSIIPGETGAKFMNDDEKELEKILRILRLMNREQLHLLYLVSLQML